MCEPLDYETKYPITNPIPSRKPKMVFVCAVATIAGIIVTLLLLLEKPFMADKGFTMDKKTNNDQTDA